MAKHPVVLVIHSSRFGQSIKIAQAVCAQLKAVGVDTEMVALDRSSAPSKRHAGVVFVCSVRYGHFDKNLLRMIAAQRAWLDSHPTLLMTVSVTARKPEKRDPAVHSYTKKLLEQAQWTPTQTEVVAGALEYPRYKPWDRWAIQLIMHLTKGPTDPKTVIEYTDWDQVRAAADRFAARLLNA